MTVYAVTGASGNIGVSTLNASPAEPQLGLVRVLASDGTNLVFALCRSPLPTEAQRPNVHEVRVDLLDLASQRVGNSAI